MPASTVNVHEAKTHFSKLIARVQAGEEIVVSRAGKPVARLVPMRPVVRRRPPADWAGIEIADEGFFEPLSPDDLAAWQGRSPADPLARS
jgi:prevent-host-death family protein